MSVGVCLCLCVVSVCCVCVCRVCLVSSCQHQYVRAAGLYGLVDDAEFRTHFLGGVSWGFLFGFRGGGEGERSWRVKSRNNFLLVTSREP